MSTTRAISYRRVSTEEQTDSGAGMTDQASKIEKAVTAREWMSVADLCDEGVSGAVAPMKRPQLAEALRMLAAGEADALIVAKLDRATRSVSDLCELLDLSDKQGWHFIALDLGIDTSTPMGRAMAQMSGVFAELERKLIGERTKAALAVKKAEGVRLGRPTITPETTRQRIAELRDSGLSWAKVAEAAEAEGHNRPSTGTPYGRSGCQKIYASITLDRVAAAA